MVNIAIPRLLRSSAMTSISPSLSTVTHSTETTTNSSASKVTTNSPTNYNYSELFSDVDWSQVNLIDIEREWRLELDQIEKVHTLSILELK